MMMKIIQEIDFWDDRRPKRLIPFRSSPFLEEINFWDIAQRPRKIDDDFVEDEQISFPGIDLGLSISSSSSSRKVSPSPSVSSSKRARSSITTFDDQESIQETTHHHKKRKISTTLTLFGTDDDHVEEKEDDDWEKRWIAKGKEKVMDDELLEPKDNNKSDQIFNPAMFEDGYNNNSRALVIYEPKDNKKKEKKKAQKPRKYLKKQSAQKQQKEPSAPLPPFMHQEIRNRGGSDPVFLFQKELTHSDVGKNLSRLFINQSEKLMEALTEEERRMVDSEEYYSGLRVLTMDEHAEDQDYEMELTRWNIGAYMIVLKKEWMKFVRANDLQEGDRVEGWGYRIQGVFCLALNVIRKAA